MALPASYHSPQLAVEVRLNTNEAPEPPPQAFMSELAGALAGLELNRYPDREAMALRSAIALHHGVEPDQVWCGNGSNEVIQAVLLAFGGPGRPAAVFEPTYALHAHIAALTSTPVIRGERDQSFRVTPTGARSVLARDPAVTFLCSPNNPTGLVEDPALVDLVLDEAPGLVVMDEAYGQFAPRSAIELTGSRPRLAVLRTFSKTWALAGLRLGYVVAAPEVVAALARVTLPYHIDAVKQMAGVLALRHGDEMRTRVARIVESRGRLASALGDLPVEVWPSEANFVLFKPLARDAGEVWQALVERGVLVRDVSGHGGVEGCLRVTVGTDAECSRFLGSLAEVLAT